MAFREEHGTALGFRPDVEPLERHLQSRQRVQSGNEAGISPEGAPGSKRPGEYVARPDGSGDYVWPKGAPIPFDGTIQFAPESRSAA